MSSTTTPTSLAPLYWLALGTFAVGTESFMIAGLLPDMAADLHTSIVATGQLVTVFALAYAFSSPILTALTGAFHRRSLMIISLSVFTLANIIASVAQNYWELMAARIVLAAAAGLYVPGANALAGAIADPERRGTALAIVNGGISIAVAFGVPLGALIGDRLGWRMTFAGVAALSAAATAGLLFGLSRAIGAGLSTATLRERIHTARKPVILMTLIVTSLWAMGAYTIYTYLALFVAETTQLQGAQIGYVLFTWGVAAAVGVFIGGKAVDRLGSRQVIIPCLGTLILAFSLLSASVHWLPKTLALIPVLISVIAWGIAHWSFYPAQQAGLVSLAGLRGTPIALSLNASFMYLGFSLGAALGSLTLSLTSVTNLGWTAAACEVAALILAVSVDRRLVRGGMQLPLRHKVDERHHPLAAASSHHASILSLRFAAETMALTEGKGVDLVDDATCSETSFVETAQMVRRGETWIVLGVGPGKTTRTSETYSPVKGILAARSASFINVNMLRYLSEPARLDETAMSFLRNGMSLAAVWPAAGKVVPHVDKTIKGNAVAISDQLFPGNIRK